MGEIIHYEIRKSTLIKRSFYDLTVMYNLDYNTMQKLAGMAQVPIAIIEAMFLDNTVLLSDALNVLKAFSEHTGHHWTLNTVKVKTASLLTFKDIYQIHQFDLDAVATQAGVPFALLDMMLVGTPVQRERACSVMDAVAEMVGRDYFFILKVALEEEKP